MFSPITRKNSKITENNFNSMLPALASTLDATQPCTTPVSHKDYDPFLAAISDKAMKAKSASTEIDNTSVSQPVFFSSRYDRIYNSQYGTILFSC